MRSLFFAAWLLACSVPVAAADDVTPFRLLDNGTILVWVRVNEAGPFLFVFDTGSTRTIVSARLAAQLRLPGAGGATLFTPSGAVPQSLVRVDSVHLDAASAGPLRVGIAASSPLDARGAAGVIGQDVLGPHVYTIDYARRRIIWRDASDVAGERVPLETQAGRTLVRAWSNGGEGGDLRLTPDSGATGLVLFARDGRSPGARESHRDVLRTLSGWRVARRVEVERLDVGNVQLRAQRALVLPAGAASSPFGDGLLPLHLFSRVTFHGPGRYMVFEARE